MLLSRAFEERAAEEYSKGNIVGFLHLYPGEEAVGAGIINAAGPADYIVSGYREHACLLYTSSQGVSCRARYHARHPCPSTITMYIDNHLGDCRHGRGRMRRRIMSQLGGQ